MCTRPVVSPPALVCVLSRGECLRLYAIETRGRHQGELLLRHQFRVRQDFRLLLVWDDLICCPSSLLSDLRVVIRLEDHSIGKPFFYC